MGKYGNIIPVLYVSIADLDLQRELDPYFDEIRSDITPSIGGNYESGQYILSSIEDHFAGVEISKQFEKFLDYCRESEIQYIEI